MAIFERLALAIMDGIGGRCLAGDGPTPHHRT